MRDRAWRRYKTVVKQRRCEMLHDTRRGSFPNWWKYRPPGWRLRHIAIHCRCDWCIEPYNRSKFKINTDKLLKEADII